MKIIPFFIPCLLLVACSSPRVVEHVVPIQESTVAGTSLDLENTENVRYSEQLKAYPIGRYVDPNHPDVMHEAHTLYRAEQSSRWNLHPNAPTAVPLGPAMAVTEPSKQTVTITTAELEEIRRQTQQMQATFEQNERLAKELEKMRKQYGDRLNSNVLTPTPSPISPTDTAEPNIDTHAVPLAGEAEK